MGDSYPTSIHIEGNDNGDGSFTSSDGEKYFPTGLVPVGPQRKQQPASEQQPSFNQQQFRRQRADKQISQLQQQLGSITDGDQHAEQKKTVFTQLINSKKQAPRQSAAHDNPEMPLFEPGQQGQPFEGRKQRIGKMSRQQITAQLAKINHQDYKAPYGHDMDQIRRLLQQRSTTLDQQQKLSQQDQLQSQPPQSGGRFTGFISDHRIKLLTLFGVIFALGAVGMIVSGILMGRQSNQRKKAQKALNNRQQSPPSPSPQTFGTKHGSSAGQDAAIAAMASDNPALHPGPFSIAFVAGWCSHCRAMKPALEQAVAQHNQRGLPPAYIVAVDDPSFAPDKKAAIQAAMAAQRVDGLPTILRFDGVSMRAIEAYRGDRTAASLAVFFSKQ